MSYILEALRKSDQQRQRGAAPTLLAMHTTAVASKRPALLLYGLLAAVLVGTGVVIGWQRPWQTEQTAPDSPGSIVAKPLETTSRDPAPAPTAAAPKPPAPQAQTTQTEPARSEMAPQPKPQPELKTAISPAQSALVASEKALRPKTKLPAPAKPQTDGPPRNADTTAAARATAPAPEQPVDIAAADAKSEQPVISMADLPPQIRETLPAMSVSVHGYSDKPEARLVGINYKILREGDSVVPGLELQQITPDGMIFSYKGYRFRRGVK